MRNAPLGVLTFESFGTSTAIWASEQSSKSMLGGDCRGYISWTNQYLGIIDHSSWESVLTNQCNAMTKGIENRSIFFPPSFGISSRVRLQSPTELWKKKRFNLQAPPVYDRKVTNFFFSIIIVSTCYVHRFAIWMHFKGEYWIIENMCLKIWYMPLSLPLVYIISCDVRNLNAF